MSPIPYFSLKYDYLLKNQSILKENMNTFNLSKNNNLNERLTLVSSNSFKSVEDVGVALIDSKMTGAAET